LLEAVVILVEDEELLQVSIDRSLKDGGFDVLTVASADDAMALLKSGVVKYSALVIDIYLKDGGSGWDVARLAREIDPSVAVVYATSASADDWRAQGVSNSVFLQKPFTLAQLVSSVAQLLPSKDTFE
jgi:DNA-binding response OmpR family regulator